MRVLHVITGLGLGGAETMLFKVIRGTAATVRHEVVSLTPGGAYAERLAALEVPVTSLGATSAPTLLRATARLATHIRESRPDVVQSWMYHANAASSIALSFQPRVPLAWNIRAHHVRPGLEKRTTVLLAHGSGRLGRRARAIVYNSGAAAAVHEAWGYPADRRVVIGNGFDLEAFRPRPDQRRALREALGLPLDAPIVGMLARWSPIKGHETFLAAASVLLAQDAGLHVVLAGEGLVPPPAALARAVDAAWGDRVHWRGVQSQPADYLGALDVLCIPSHDEAFPNVLGEAMACEVPVVVTDTGECRTVAGNTALVVPPRDPAAMAEAVRHLLREAPAARAARVAGGRAHIAAHWSLPAIAAEYASLWRQVAA